MNFNIYIDGGSRGNPGPAGAGVVIHADGDQPFIVHEAGYFLGRTTNNVAEYHGLLRALEHAIALKPDAVNIFSDSELMVRQVAGEYKVKSPILKPLHARATALLAKAGRWQIQHIYREANARADELANMAMDARRDVVVTSGEAFKAAKITPPPVERPGSGQAGNERAGKAPLTNRIEGDAKEHPFIRWTATLLTGPGDKCPARCPANHPYAFGPDTPAGFCADAAKAVFAEDPASWDEPHPGARQVACPRCGTAIRIQIKR